MTTFIRPHLRPSETNDIRLADFLDDKLQSAADLSSLSALVSNVETQRAQLQSQLDSATAQLQRVRSSTNDRQTSLASQIDTFQRLQHGIDVRLQIVAASDAPDDAIARLQGPVDRLNRVTLAQSYLECLQDVEKLSSQARSCLPARPKEALEPYTRLRKLLVYMQQLQVEADGAAVHLVAYVEGVAEKLWEEMKSTMWKEFEGVLVKEGWPRVDMEEPVDREWLESFTKCIELQVPEVIYTSGVVTLLPIDVMAQIFIKEFRFHFLGDKPTAKAQSVGTHCYPWVLNLLEKWEDFFREQFGYILGSKFADTSAADQMVYVDPVCALITTMLPVLREKLDSVMLEAGSNAAFLSGFLVQLMDFDDVIRDKYNYDGGHSEQGWDGLTTELLGRYFDPWLAAEKSFALERFNTIMDAADARNLDYDFSEPGKTKPTFAAIRIVDLLQSVTGQYERVRRFSHKLRFLIDIQLALLDEYHDRLRGSLEAYYSITSVVGRSLHGASKEQLAALEGTGAFESLCKVYSSAEYVVATLRDWSNEEFFVELYDTLLARARSSEDGQNLAGNMSLDQVKDRTSSVVGTEGDGGAIFDETIAAYNARKRTAQEFLISALAESHSKAIRPYLTRPQWTTINEEPNVDPYQLAITAELDEPLRIIKRNLDFLSRALAIAPFRRIAREALQGLQETLWAEVLMRQKFTTLGAAQLTRDTHAILSLIDRYIPEGGMAIFGGLADGVKLLSIPVEPPEGETGVWGLSLSEASDRVFTDNAEAKSVLEEMDIDSLTPAHARQILQRRVENAE